MGWWWAWGCRDVGGGNGPGSIGMQGMSNRAWVGAEGEQVGQGGAWKSFPTLCYAIMKTSYAITKKERLFWKRERRGREGVLGVEGAAGRVSWGQIQLPAELQTESERLLVTASGKHRFGLVALPMKSGIAFLPTAGLYIPRIN